MTSRPDTFFAGLRRAIIEKIQVVLGKNDISALGLGYFIGQKGQFSDELLENIQLAGMSHMIVVSGFHLGIAMMAFRRLAEKVSRFAVLFSAFVISGTFLAIVGVGSGLLRASIVTLLSLLAWYFGRRFHPIRLLAYAAAITLIIDPTLVVDVGWQYSFSAFAGLTLFAPVLACYFYDNRNIGWLPSIIIQSFSAQLFCLPISIYNFGAVSVVGLLSNIVVSPSISIVMVLMLAICVAPP